jgi:hypothetical protein
MPEGNDFRRKVREFLYGMFGHDTALQALELRGSMETLFMLVTFGDMVGLPIMPPYYALRLLPYAAELVPAWKRRVMRERFFGDDHEHHLHGV